MYHHIRLRIRDLPLSQLPNLVEQACISNNFLYFSTKRSPKAKKPSNRSRNGNKDRRDLFEKDQTNLSPLEQIKTNGLDEFEKMTSQAVSKSRKLLTDDNKSDDGKEMLTIAQLRKAEHIERTLTQAIDKISRHESIFNIGGEPIDVTDVEVSSDLRYARVLWSLPFEIEKDISREVSTEERDIKRDKIISKMQNVIEAKGRVRLQGLINISVKGRAPKLRFVHESKARNRRQKLAAFLDDENIDHELLKYL